MNEILFMIGDMPVTAGVALMGFSALALGLLLTIAIIIARSGSRGAAMAMAQAIRADELEERLSEVLKAQNESHRPRRRHGPGLGRPSGRHGTRGVRATGLRDPSRRPIHGTDHPQHDGKPERAA